jgi:hypothetical protein
VLGEDGLAVGVPFDLPAALPAGPFEAEVDAADGMPAKREPKVGFFTGRRASPPSFGTLLSMRTFRSMPTGRPPKWAADDLDRALAAYGRGETSVRAVKREYGVPPTTLLRYARERGVTVRPSGMTGLRGEAHPTWKGGSRLSEDGYVRTYTPDHPFPRDSGYVYEHVRVMELELGRRLEAHESVHHLNHVRADNRRENLELVVRGAHSRHHRSLDVHRRTRDDHGRFA